MICNNVKHTHNNIRSFFQVQEILTMEDTLNGPHILDVLQYVKGREEFVLDEDFATTLHHLPQARAAVNKVLVVLENKLFV